MAAADDLRQQSLHGVGARVPTAKAFGRGDARRAVKQARLNEARPPIVGRHRSSTQVRPTICEPARSTPQSALIQEAAEVIHLVGIAGRLLMSTAFLVYHSVVREQHSVLVPPRRRNRAKDPL